MKGVPKLAVLILFSKHCFILYFIKIFMTKIKGWFICLLRKMFDNYTVNYVEITHIYFFGNFLVVYKEHVLQSGTDIRQWVAKLSSNI